LTIGLSSIILEIVLLVIHDFINSNHYNIGLCVTPQWVCRPRTTLGCLAV